MYYQQGDVVIKKVSKIPKDSKKLDHLILAEGEATGHHHQINTGLAVLLASGNDMFLNVISDYAKLKHEEHQKIDLKKSNYQIGIVQEYDHFEEESKQVLD